MTRSRNTGSGQTHPPTPLQQVTQFFCTAPLSDARVAVEIAQTIVAARQLVTPVTPVTPPGDFTPPSVTDAIREAQTRNAALGQDGRVVRRGRPRAGLPAAVVAPAQVGELPEQIAPEDE